MQTDNTTKQILAQIVSAISGTQIETVESLIAATDVVKGCRFIAMRDYKSDATNNTESANHVINIGFIYENMKAKDIDLLVNVLTGEQLVNTQNIDLENLDYSTINTGKLTLTEYKEAVRNSMPLGYSELITSASAVPGTSGRENNDIYLNNVLVFNTNTQSLSIIGQSVSKTVLVEGEIKVTKKAPLTLAKELIRQAAGLKTNSYRRFKIENLNSVKISGEVIDIS
ncbi:MAG: hypothetical protein ABIP51_20580 [Bacteroidia bacterium]